MPISLSPSRMTLDIDMERDGKQYGHLLLPFSCHRSAYGRIAIPVAVIRHGDGPSVLLTAGNHGDEYEGQIALMELGRQLQPEDIQGRLLIMPALNLPAVRAGLRTSPLDDGNLNRAFPGDSNGTPTAMLAHYLESQILPQMEVCLDLHSGGSSLLYVPSTLRGFGGDKALDARALELQRVFAAPIGFNVAALGEDRTLGAAARRQNVVYLATEAGGAATVSPKGLAMTRRGIRRVLRHLGVWPTVDVGEEPLPSRLLNVGGMDFYVLSPAYGLYEPLVELGDEVVAEQPAALIHYPEEPWRTPTEVAFQRDGVAFCKRVPGLVEQGDCLFQLGEDLE